MKAETLNEIIRRNCLISGTLFLIDEEKLIFCGPEILDGCKTTKSLFDIIDELILYPSDWERKNNTVCSFADYEFGVANGEIIVFSFGHRDDINNCNDIVVSLMSFDEENWTSNIVETDDQNLMCEMYFSRLFQFSQLMVLKNARKER